MQYKIFVIVITYNGFKWIDKCFGSLLSSTIPLKIIAIDNASSDGTPGFIRKKFSEVELIEAGDNLGFGKANNIGLKVAMERNADYVFLLNQDAWIEPDTIEKLINISEANLQYGIISPIHLNGEGNAIDYNFSNYLCPATTAGFYSDLLLGELKSVYDSIYVNAAAWLLTSKCVSDVGVFSPRFRHYGEDDEYIFRLRKKGLKIGIVPSAKIYHDRKQGVANEKVFTENNIYTKALLTVFSSNILPKKHFLVRRILGNIIINILFFGKNEGVKVCIKRDIIAIKILNKRNKLDV